MTTHKFNPYHHYYHYLYHYSI